MNKKSLYPNFLEFEGHINIFKDSVLGILKCTHCNSQVNVKLNGDTSKFTDEYIKNKVLKTAQNNHNCPAKISMWTDKDVLKRDFSEFVESWERYKEKEYKQNASGK